MQWLFKVGYKKLVPDLTERLKYWADCQLVDIRPTGFYPAKAGKHFCIIEDGKGYWEVRGDTDWKSTKQSVLDLKKYLTVADANGRYPWDIGYNEELVPARRRDWFLDYKYLLDQGLIVSDQFDMIYDKEREGIIYLDRDITQLLSHEDAKTRLESVYSERTGTVSSGTYTIGAAGNYATLTAAEADIAAQLTGNLTFEHLNEETAISAAVTFDVDTNGHLLKITAASGAEHNGGAYGNGARINFGTYDYGIVFDETDSDVMTDVELSKIALDISGTLNFGVVLADVGNSGGGGNVLVDRMLIKGDNTSGYGIDTSTAYDAVIRNCIVYGCSKSDNAAYGIGIKNESYSCNTLFILNNTVIGCNDNMWVRANTTTTYTYKNNLTQAGGSKDWNDTGAGWGTHTYNVSEDATSPDAAYQEKDVHTNSVFQNYAGNDYRLDSEGDSTNLAILDDGEDLSGTFIDDIQGYTRGTWYIGASQAAQYPEAMWSYGHPVIITNYVVGDF